MASLQPSRIHSAFVSLLNCSHFAQLSFTRVKQAKEAFKRDKKAVFRFFLALTIDLCLGMLLTAALAERFPPKKQVRTLNLNSFSLKKKKKKKKG